MEPLGLDEAVGLRERGEGEGDGEEEAACEGECGHGVPQFIVDRPRTKVPPFLRFSTEAHFPSRG